MKITVSIPEEMHLHNETFMLARVIEVEIDDDYIALNNLHTKKVIDGTQRLARVEGLRSRVNSGQQSMHPTAFLAWVIVFVLGFMCGAEYVLYRLGGG